MRMNDIDITKDRTLDLYSLQHLVKTISGPEVQNVTFDIRHIYLHTMLTPTTHVIYKLY